MALLDREQVEKLVNSGDEYSCRLLFEHFYGKTYAAVMAITRNHQTSEDLVQEAFIRAFNGLKQLREPSKFGAWVGTIATNLARDYLKKNKKIFWTSEIEKNYSSSEVSVEDQLMEKEEAREVRSLLRSLPSEQYQVIILYYYYEMRVEDMASFMKVNVGTVKSRLHRARRKLYNLLQQGELNGALNRPSSNKGSLNPPGSNKGRGEGT